MATLPLERPAWMNSHWLGDLIRASKPLISIILTQNELIDLTKYFSWIASGKTNPIILVN